MMNASRPTRRRRSRSLLLNMFLAMALIVALPVLVLIAMTDYALVSSVNREIARAGMGKLKVAAGINVMVEEILRNTAVRITLDPRLENLASIKEFHQILESGERLFAFMLYQNQLGEYITTHRLIHSIYIYLRGVDWVISTVDGTVHKIDFTDRDWLESLLASPPEEWDQRSWVPRFPRPSKFQEGIYALIPEGQKVISRIYSLSPYLSTLDGWIIINLRERELSRLINSANFEQEGSISLVSPGGLVISNPQQELVGRQISETRILAAINGDRNTGWTLVPTRRGQNLVTWFRPEADWRIILGEFDLGGLTAEIGRVRLVSLGVSLIVMLMGLGVAWFVSRRFLNPVHRLVQTIKSRAELTLEKEENEVKVLESAIGNLLRQETQWFTALEKLQRQNREERIVHLIKHQSEQTTEEDLAICPDHQCMGGFLAIDGFREYQLRFGLKDQGFIRSLLGHMMEETFQPEVCCLWSTIDENGIWLIFHWDPEIVGTVEPSNPDHYTGDSAILAFFAHRYNLILSQIQQVLQGSASLYLGPIFGDPSSLQGCQRQIIQGLKQRFIYGWGACYPHTIPVRSGTGNYYPRKEVRRILSALEGEYPESLHQELDTLFRILKSHPGLNFDRIVLVLNQLISDLVKFILDRNISPADVEGMEENLQRPIIEWETLDQLHRWFGGILERCLEMTRKPVEGHGIDAILAFIRSNFHRDIGIETVAEQVGLSYSHVRKIFKDHRGESMVSFINSLRIEAAKELLRTTDSTLEAIAIGVGYNNTQGLNRYFKRMVGLTPGHYREQLRR